MEEDVPALPPIFKLPKITVSLPLPRWTLWMLTGRSGFRWKAAGI